MEIIFLKWRKPFYIWQKTLQLKWSTRSLCLNVSAFKSLIFKIKVILNYLKRSLFLSFLLLTNYNFDATCILMHRNDEPPTRLRWLWKRMIYHDVYWETESTPIIERWLSEKFDIRIELDMSGQCPTVRWNDPVRPKLTVILT